MGADDRKLIDYRPRFNIKYCIQVIWANSFFSNKENRKYYNPENINSRYDSSIFVKLYMAPLLLSIMCNKIVKNQERIVVDGYSKKKKKENRASFWINRLHHCKSASHSKIIKIIFLKMD